MQKNQYNMKVFIYILALTSFIAFSQKKYLKQIDSLRYINHMPYSCTSSFGPKGTRSPGCGDKIFWNIVKSKDSVINLLINKLDDPRMTKAVVALFGDNYAVADIAYVALEEIIHSFPTYDFLQGQKESDCGYCVYWNYVRKNITNRKKFKSAVRKWYEKNKDKLVWIKSDYQFHCGEMSFLHPNGGHYELQN